MIVCGRFTLYADPDFLEDYFDLENEMDLGLEQRYNIAPTQPVLTIVQGKQKQRAGYMKWGLIPHWSKDDTFASKMINARSETLREKRSFQGLLGRRHCIICANGFYEWKKIDKKKQPYYIKLQNQEVMMFAGLWDRWRNQNGKEVVSCTVLTTKANDMMEGLHERMPVILTKENSHRWLNCTSTNAGEMVELFNPFPSEKMTVYPVSTLVNKAANDGPECIAPINKM